MAANKEAWVIKIKAHAMERYDKGWDFIIECYNDTEILKVFEDFECNTYAKALGEFKSIVKLNKEMESNCW